MKQELIIAEDDGIRLDRWFRRYYPQVTQAHLQKLLRKGLVKLDGKKVEANVRVQQGQTIKLPTIEEAAPSTAAPKAKPKFTLDMADDIRRIQQSVLFKNDALMVINKPAGLATQGGTKVEVSVDSLLDYLCFEKKERPKLVHRLDKDTSGALVLARTSAAATALMHFFKDKEMEKYYLALVKGVPAIRQGTINLPIAKQGTQKEKMEVCEVHGQKAITDYEVVESLGQQCSWVVFKPLTGRTHQIRVHAAHIGHPIVGDGKYGGRAAFVEGIAIPKQMHLHAWRIIIPTESGRPLTITAPLPPHMEKTAEILGFSARETAEAFL